MDDWRQKIVEMLERGQKIEAIKIYREATGIGLAEAKSFVEGLERSLATGELPPAAAATGEEPETDADVIELLRSGSKLQAIKRYRERHGVGLKEAADAVERMAVGAGIQSTGKGCAVFGVLFAITAGGAIAWAMSL